MIVASAGHIDHGKTTLVRALTGIDTDRLPEEKARGISIDVGFAHCTLPGGQLLGFVDVPGHERFVRNMLSGVYAIGHFLLVIAADDGVMPQTREHLQIIRLLGVASGTVVITKIDRVEAARVAAVAEEARQLLHVVGLPELPVLPLSARSGEGLDALRERLAAVAQGEQQQAQAPGALARFVVDQVFSASGSGTIARGTVIAGSVSAGDMVEVRPAGITGRLRKLQRHGQVVESAGTGERCALNLAGVEQAQVQRGDWIVAPGAAAPTDRLDVQVRVLASEAGPLKHWLPVHVHIGAADVPGRLATRRGASLAPGEHGYAQLRLQRPVQATHGDRFILRDQSATRTLGGGAVLDPYPPLRGSVQQRSTVLDALAAGGVRGSLEALLAAPTVVDLQWLASVFGVPLQAALQQVPPGAVLVRSEPPVALANAQAEQLRQRTLERLRQFHAERGSVAGIELARLHQEVDRSLRADVYAALVKAWAPGAGLQLRGSQMALAGHDSTDNPRDRQAWERVRPMLLNAGAAIPSVRELADQARLPLQPLRDLLHRKAGQGALVRLTLERFALPETLEMLATKARETAARRPDGLFTAAQYRDTIGTGRGLAIEILEGLDRLGVTVRRGDLRALREGGPA